MRYLTPDAEDLATDKTMKDKFDPLISATEEAIERANAAIDRARQQDAETADPIAQVIADRQPIYGDPKAGHTAIGLAWTAIINQAYGKEMLPGPLGPTAVAQMMAVMKIIRAARSYHPDNYLDCMAYLRFAQDFQKVPYDHS